MTEKAGEFRPERIMELSERLSLVAGQKVGEITSVNKLAKMLSINALIAATQAGEAGRGFAVVAEEFKKISAEIDDVASGLETEVRADLQELKAVGSAILGHIRGQRLADLALNAIDIIDRNLYERTCDVRWWATDSAVVACLSEPSTRSAQHASRRLRVILNAYTVYLDLWICDASGQVVSNGRPDLYPGVTGTAAAGSSWFRQAMETSSGDDFVACDVELAPALQGLPVATYAAAIREGGRRTGRAIGVLGIHFDWRPQSQAVLRGVRLSDEERERSRVVILDRKRRVLASSDGIGELQEVFELDTSRGELGSYARNDVTIGYAATPGYETYKGLGWYGCIVQRPATPLGAARSARAA